MSKEEQISCQRSLGVVLKTVERCNIDCTYCYMFNMGDETYLKRPIYLSEDTIESIAKFLKEGCAAENIERLILEYHGGEPLMQGKKEFDAMCSYFEAELKGTVEVEMVMQTNGMLLDDDWLRLARKYHIGLGMSLDGPKEYHDQYRIDKQGRGTYDKVVEKLAYAQNSPIMAGFPHKIGVLAVLNPKFDAKKIYRHFVDDLKLVFFDFLGPFNTYEHEIDFTPEEYGNFWCDLFDEWVKDNNPKIQIRFLRSILNNFFGKSSLIYGVGPSNSIDLPLISIATDGELTPTDELRAVGNDCIYSNATVFNTTLSDFLKSNIFKEINYAQSHLPEKCEACCWQKVCGGGSIVNRYRKENNFNNPSRYCEGLQMLYRRIMYYLTENGYSIEYIARLLQGESTTALEVA
jgi:uncharacterized protein